MSRNIEEFTKYLDSHFRKSRNSILEVGIRNKENLEFFSWNNKNAKKCFGLGSISKTAIATYICELIKDNKIDLDHTIDTYLPLKKRKRYPTILSLLTHTSGYHGFIPFFKTMFVMITNGFNKRNIYGNVDNEWLLQSIDKKRPFRREKYRYSDYNYAVLALIIETLEKQPYKEVIINYLRNQIGMESTFYGSLQSTQYDCASWVWEDNNPFLASGGLFSTTEDMIKFLDYQINNDNLQPALQKYHRLNLNKNVFTGFSWNSFYKGHFYWHIGGQGCYRSYALFDTKKDISIIILATVDINIQHVNRLGSSLYRNVKRNYQLINEYLKTQQ